MSRISKQEYRFLKNEETKRQARQEDFKTLISSLPKPDQESSNFSEAQKAVNIVVEMRDQGYDVFDAVVLSKGFIASTDSDTHGKNRAWETFFGGRGDGSPEPDALWGEIKLSQITKEHTLEQVMTIGTLSKRNKETKEREVKDNFEDSYTYKKLKKCFVTTYYQEGKQKGHKISESFVFEVENPLWYDRIKEDWEFYRDEYRQRYADYKAGKIKKRASGIMKSDTKGGRCPNGTLGIRSDSIIFNKKFFKEASEYYAK